MPVTVTRLVATSWLKTSRADWQVACQFCHPSRWQCQSAGLWHTGYPRCCSGTTVSDNDWLSLQVRPGWVALRLLFRYACFDEFSVRAQPHGTAANVHNAHGRSSVESMMLMTWCQYCLNAGCLANRPAPNAHVTSWRANWPASNVCVTSWRANRPAPNARVTPRHDGLTGRLPTPVSRHDGLTGRLPTPVSPRQWRASQSPNIGDAYSVSNRPETPPP